MAVLNCMIKGKEIENVKEDFRNSERVEQFRIGSSALYLPEGLRWKYIPYGDIQSAEESFRVISAGHCVPVREKRPEIDTEKFVDPMKFINRLSIRLPEDAIYIADVGQNQIWSCRWHLVKSGRFLTSGGMGTMGYSIPAALGAKYAAPDKKVLAVMGDGAFQMSMMELSTLKQYGINVGIIVFNNGYLGMVREYQHYSLSDRYNMVELHNTPKLDKIAQAYDMKYLKASNQKEADSLVDELVSSEGCVLCEVIVDPMDLAK